MNQTNRLHFLSFQSWDRKVSEIVLFHLRTSLRKNRKLMLKITRNASCWCHGTQTFTDAVKLRSVCFVCYLELNSNFKLCNYVKIKSEKLFTWIIKQNT